MPARIVAENAEIRAQRGCLSVSHREIGAQGIGENDYGAAGFAFQAVTNPRAVCFNEGHKTNPRSHPEMDTHFFSAFLANTFSTI